MNQIEIVQQFLARITYKPGWKFIALMHPSCDQIKIHLSYLARDARLENNEGEITLTSITIIHPHSPTELTEENLRSAIIRQILQAEMHERDEWLRLDGKHVTDPHPELTHHTSASSESPSRP